jgi:hypothetical protein
MDRGGGATMGQQQHTEGQRTWHYSSLMVAVRNGGERGRHGCVGGALGGDGEVARWRRNDVEGRQRVELGGVGALWHGSSSRWHGEGEEAEGNLIDGDLGRWGGGMQIARRKGSGGGQSALGMVLGAWRIENRDRDQKQWRRVRSQCLL